MIEIRRIHPDELIQVRKLHTVVFNQRSDFSKESPPDPLANPAEWTWGAFENGILASVIVEIEFMMRFDGSAVPMSGIAGVGTLPEYRKSRLVRSIFGKLLPEAFEKGVVFSTLAPFSHAFYRKFGYELVCVLKELTIPAIEFSRYKIRGSLTQIFPGDDTAELQKIHSAYIANINHGILRDYWPGNRGWKLFTKDDPYSTGTYTYLWRDETGESKAYIKYQDQAKNDEHIMAVRELVFTDRDALAGILGIVSGLTAQFKIYQWRMPSFLDPTDLVPVAWEAKQQLVPRDMTRVINVKKALELMRRPEGEGSYIIETTDENIPANSGAYLVEYGPEGSRVSSTTKDADLICDIPALSQLITGYRTLENMLYTRQGGVDVKGDLKKLNRVFTLRPQHVTENF
jgi:predicted acetyltransferase